MSAQDEQTNSDEKYSADTSTSETPSNGQNSTEVVESDNSANNNNNNNNNTPPVKREAKFVYVTNISLEVNEEHLRNFFGFCGKIIQITLLP